ncbi:hypothetical protein HRbin29_02060 [bacterium HR29]|jgi:hypothetical protein|nr:hypothetical protein HRbin29_02060 [bacterium HR29]
MLPPEAGCTLRRRGTWRPRAERPTSRSTTSATCPGAPSPATASGPHRRDRSPNRLGVATPGRDAPGTAPSVPGSGRRFGDGGRTSEAALSVDWRVTLARAAERRARGRTSAILDRLDAHVHLPTRAGSRVSVARACPLGMHARRAGGGPGALGALPLCRCRGRPRPARRLRSVGEGGRDPDGSLAGGGPALARMPSPPRAPLRPPGRASAPSRGRAPTPPAGRGAARAASGSRSPSVGSGRR